MNEQEARAELIANIYDVESVLPYIDRYRDSILAAQPCYRVWYVVDASMPTCLDVDGDHPKCLACQARERMKAELTTV